MEDFLRHMLSPEEIAIKERIHEKEERFQAIFREHYHLWDDFVYSVQKVIEPFTEEWIQEVYKRKPKRKILQKIEERFDVLLKYLEEILPEMLNKIGINPSIIKTQGEQFEKMGVLARACDVEKKGESFKIENLDIYMLTYSMPAVIAGNVDIKSLWLCMENSLFIAYTSKETNPSEETKKKVMALWKKEKLLAISKLKAEPSKNEKQKAESSKNLETRKAGNLRKSGTFPVSELDQEPTSEEHHEFLQRSKVKLEEVKSIFSTRYYFWEIYNQHFGGSISFLARKLFKSDIILSEWFELLDERVNILSEYLLKTIPKALKEINVSIESIKAEARAFEESNEYIPHCELIEIDESLKIECSNAVSLVFNVALEIYTRPEINTIWISSVNDKLYAFTAKKKDLSDEEKEKKTDGSFPFPKGSYFSFTDLDEFDEEKEKISSND